MLSKICSSTKQLLFRTDDTLLHFLFFILNFCYIYLSFVCLCVQPLLPFGGQRPTFRSWFSPLPTWVLGIVLGLGSTCPCLLRYLTGPKLIYHVYKHVWCVWARVVAHILCAHARAHTWTSEDNKEELSLTFPPWVPGAKLTSSDLGSKHLYSLSHLAASGPLSVSFIFFKLIEFTKVHFTPH